MFRRGFVEAKNKEHRILFGQEWEVMSPLWPASLNYIPGSAAGNLGYRRAQLRYDRNFFFSDRFLFITQHSANLGINWDFDTDPTVIGQTAGWPVLEGRLAARLGKREGPCALPKEFGVSWNLGEEIYDVLPTFNPPGGEESRKKNVVDQFRHERSDYEEVHNEGGAFLRRKPRRVYGRYPAGDQSDHV